MLLKELPDALKPFGYHGVHFSGAVSNKDWLADCPFCGKEKAFSVHSETSQFTCHSREEVCGVSGNKTTFLEFWLEVCKAETTAEHWKQLQEDRDGLPYTVFKRNHLAWDEYNGRWLVPTFNKDGRVWDIRNWKKGSKIKSTAGTSPKLWGLDALFNSSPKARVWVCEGEFDALALKWLLARAGFSTDVVVSTPGAKVFRSEWVELIGSRNVIVCPDNDGAGDAMAEKWYRGLSTRDKGSLKFFNYPETMEAKVDIRDLITTAVIENEIPAKRYYKRLRSMIKETHTAMPFDGQEDIEAAKTGKRKSSKAVDYNPETIPSFQQVLDVFSSYFKLTPDYILALQAAFAVHLSTNWQGEPVWLFLCGSPGSGKTEILCSMEDVPDTLFRNSVTSKNLVSGFNTNGKADPSLIPKMIDKCTIFKDWTEVLNSNPNFIEETYSAMRHFFDGKVDKSFGNNVERFYVGKGNVLAGVTNIIHGRNDASCGERFLKLQLPAVKSGMRRKIILQAIRGIGAKEENREAVRNVVEAFLNRLVPYPPGKCLPRFYEDKIEALVNLIAFLRQKVEWTYSREGDILQVKPEPELPTRLAVQLAKLAMANMIILGKDKVDGEVFKLVERVSYDTAYGFGLDIITAMMEKNDGKAITINELVELTGLPYQTVLRKMKDLLQTEIVIKSTLKKYRRGANPGGYIVTKEVRDLWTAANLQEGIEHVKRSSNLKRKGRGYHD